MPHHVYFNCEFQRSVPNVFFLKFVLFELNFTITPLFHLDFPNQPPLPPSIAQARLREVKEEFNVKKFFKAIGKLFLNKAFVIHMITYGINVAVFLAISTLLTQFVLEYFEVSQFLLVPGYKTKI